METGAIALLKRLGSLLEALIVWEPLPSNARGRKAAAFSSCINEELGCSKADQGASCLSAG